MQCGFPDAALATTTSATAGQAVTAPVRHRNFARDAESEQESEQESNSDDSESEEADIALFHEFRASQAAAARNSAEVRNKSAHIQQEQLPAQVRTVQTPGVKSSCFATTCNGENQSEVGDAVRVVKQVTTFYLFCTSCVSNGMLTDTIHMYMMAFLSFCVLSRSPSNAVYF